MRDTWHRYIAAIYLTAFFSFACSWTTNAQLNNVVIGEASEPAIAISRKDIKDVAAAGYPGKAYMSADSGATWQTVSVTSRWGDGGNHQLLSDRKGNFFNLYLSYPDGGLPKDRIVCGYSKDNGVSWEEKSFVVADPTKSQSYPRAVMHFRSGALYLTWTQFDKYGSSDPEQKSNVFFSQSKDGGKWTTPVLINQLPGDCSDGAQSVRGAVPTVYADGKIFIAWSGKGKIWFDRSYNKGETWLNNDVAVTDQPGGSSMAVPGFPHCSGMPALDIDNSASRFHGSIYLVFADQRKGNDDTNVWLMRSGNFGDYWTQPVDVHLKGSEKTHQFMPVVTVDHTTGYVYILYYDRSAYDDMRTDVAIAYSTDGGSSFKNARVSESPFTPPANGISRQSYLNIDAYRGVIAAIWTRVDENGKASLVTSVFKHEQLAIND